MAWIAAVVLVVSLGKRDQRIAPGNGIAKGAVWREGVSPRDRITEVDGLYVSGIEWMDLRMILCSQFLSVSNSSSGRRWKLDHAPAVGDPTHMVEFGTGRRAFAREA